MSADILVVSADPRYAKSLIRGLAAVNPGVSVSRLERR